MDIKTGDHEMTKFLCVLCQYKTNNKKDYGKHLLTPKHKKHSFTINKSPKMEDGMFHCICEKKYIHQSGLSKHKKKCILVKNGVNGNSEEEPVLIKQLIKQYQSLLMENKEFKSLIMDLVAKPIPAINTNITNNVNNHNSNNKQFNLQFFLNETCKNAMNITEFVDSLEIKSCELEDFGKLGYIQGISNIFIRGLKELDETERPLHCTDKKREILYIKHNNIWEKDSDKEKMIKTIKDIANKNFKRIPKWKQDNPLSEDNSTKKHMEYMHILNQVMTGITPDDEVGINKIIKKIALEVYIDK